MVTGSKKEVPSLCLTDKKAPFPKHTRLSCDVFYR